jgi:hypothetical protein
LVKLVVETFLCNVEANNGIQKEAIHIGVPLSVESERVKLDLCAECFQALAVTLKPWIASGEAVAPKGGAKASSAPPEPAQSVPETPTAPPRRFTNRLAVPDAELDFVGSRWINGVWIRNPGIKKFATNGGYLYAGNRPSAALVAAYRKAVEAGEHIPVIEGADKVPGWYLADPRNPANK